jgi:glycosyltransferase involved in cell wall biosynthesis
LPYSVQTHAGGGLREAVEAFARAHEVDVWQVEWTPYAEAVKGLPRRRQLVVAHNVESLIWQRYFENEANPLKKWYIGRQCRKFERFEQDVFRAAPHAVAVSEEDAARLRDEFGGRAVSLVENGVDTAYFRPGEGRRDPRRILFLGSLDWRPNLDAVRLLLDLIFPEVRRGEPGARLCLVGRNPPAWLRRAAAGAPGLELHADVADVRPYLASSGMLAVPLRIGGGSRIKILEALAAGLPVVSTRVGAEGLRLTPGEHLEVVQTPEQMSGALLAVMRAEGEYAEQARRGRDRVVGHYDWGRLALQLEQVWRTVALGENGLGT